MAADYVDVDSTVRPSAEAQWLEEAMEDFLAESAACLDHIEGALDDLEQSPCDATIAGILRALHTLKGTASCLGLSTLAGIAHECETLAGESWRGGIVSATSVRTLRNRCGTARTMVAALRVAAGDVVKDDAGDGSLRSLLVSLVPLVHSLAQRQHKHIRVEIDASELEVDPQSLRALKASLVHIIRNTVDHGIEPSIVRPTIGKSAQGTVWLRAFEQDGEIVIEIADDGKGLDGGAIRAAAIEHGVVTEAQAEGLSDAEVQQLVFCRGLTMAKAVTLESGRGLGMDIVKTEIERAGGRVSVRSSGGRGTLVTIVFPCRVV